MTTERQMPDFVPICKLSDVPSGQGKMIRPTQGRLATKPVAVFNDNGKIYVTNFVCPHTGGPMSEGTIKDGVVECPYHAWAFNAETGISAGKGDHPIDIYEVKVEGDDILLGWLKPTPARP
jgi:nitrite reductase (NADH) small subunit